MVEEVLKMAAGHLRAPDHASYLEQVWGGTGGATVRKYRDKISNILEELKVSGDVGEACRSVREMNLPFFHHEVHPIIGLGQAGV